MSIVLRVTAVCTMMATAGFLLAAAQTQPAGQSTKHAEALETVVTRTSDVLAKDPTNAEAWEVRGEAYFRLGQIDKAIADFDRFLKLQPDEKPQHWQRGIALYEAGQFEAGAKQFALHHDVNPDDVENTAWHFLCVARTAGVEKARGLLIPTHGDPRVPLMQIYDLYGGRAKVQDVLNAIELGNPAPEELRSRRFYGHLYLGLYFEAMGQLQPARDHVRQSVEFADEGYMGDAARVHLVRMTADGDKTKTAPQS